MSTKSINLKKIFGEIYIVQNFKEMEWLVEKVEKIIEDNTNHGKPSAILEIGVEMGGTMKVWEDVLKRKGKQDNLKENILIGIDISPNIQWDIKSSPITTELIIGNSHDPDTLRQVKKILFDNRLPGEDTMRLLDFIYVDGEHTPEAAKKDYFMYAGLVRNGGGVGFHDVFDVKKFLDNLNQTKLETFRGNSPFGQYGVQSGIGTAFYRV